MPTSISPAQHRDFIEFFNERSWLISLHDGPPGASGEHEIVGGYYHQHAVRFDENGTNTEQIDILVPKCRVTHIGVWRSDGTFRFGQITDARAMNEGELYRIPAHALSLVAAGG